MQTIPHAAILTLIAGSTFQSLAIAQEAVPEAEPKNQPNHQQIQIIDPANDTLPRMGTNQTPIEPTEPGTSKPHQTGLTEGQDWMKVVNNSIDTVSKPSSLAEGSFILSRSGRLLPAPNDRLIFVPDPEQRLPGEGPVLLLPCATLESLEGIWANQPVTVSGEILSYHGRNHLLISDFSLGVPVTTQTKPAEPEVQPEPETETEIEPDPDAETETDPNTELNEDPDVLDLLRELDEENAAPSGVQIIDTNPNLNSSRFSSQQSNQLQSAPPSLAPGLREGALLIRRPARLDRAHDGSWMAVFDNDDESSPSGIELTMLPCSLLMSMENQTVRFGDSTKFVVSGRLYIHNGRGYLLPTFYQRLRTSDIKPWQ